MASLRNVLTNQVSSLMVQRNIARKNRNWNLADYIRGELRKLNIVIADKKNESVWFFKE